MKAGSLRVKFVALWTLLTALKLGLASRLPLLVDEAFYGWEGRYLDWAYADLPGLAAWLTRLGTELGGMHPLALRLPFLLMGAAVPWLVVGISRRWFGAELGWCAGLLSLLMPLSALLGVLALPDVPLVFAGLLCVDAISRLRERVTVSALALLGVGLVLGAQSHYRFVLVIAAGLVGVCMDRSARRLLRDWRIWATVLLGVAAWIPLLAWNMQHANSGLRFQLLERNPWSFDAGAVVWLPIQMMLLTPPLFLLLVATLQEAWRRRASGPWALLGSIAAVSVPGYFLLGFFADQQRVSFHWPLAGWLVLVIAAPVVMRGWSQWAARSVWVTGLVGVFIAIAFLSVAASRDLRVATAVTKAYPADFAGSDELVNAAEALKSSSSDHIVAGDFGLAAQLAFALERRDILVLDSPRNAKHGRATQLQAWGLLRSHLPSVQGGRTLLFIEDSGTPMKQRLGEYHARCTQLGGLPSPRILNVDHGRKRYLIYVIGKPPEQCDVPALAWIDRPRRGQRVGRRFEVAGWAFKDGSGLSTVRVTLDGRHLADTHYGNPMPHVASYWRISKDPRHPNVGFTVQVDVGPVEAGTHWLGVQMVRPDGQVETWVDQPIRVGD